MPKLNDIAQLLHQHRATYGSLDVFASDVDELRAGSGHPFHREADGVFTTQAGQHPVRVRLLGNNVARFELTSNNQGVGAVGGAVAGAAVGAAVGGQGRRTDVGPAMIFGMLMGGLIGAMAAAPAQQVMTLRFDPDLGRWNVYHGPYVGWAKEAFGGP